MATSSSEILFAKGQRDIRLHSFTETLEATSPEDPSLKAIYKLVRIERIEMKEERKVLYEAPNGV